MDVLKDGNREVANKYQTELLGMDDLNDYNIDEVEHLFLKLKP